MEQRRLRLGDIVDDYCPRERRVTNHAVVAMVEEDIKQTRCTTCDAEHPYKGGHAPRRRKKDSTGALYKEVLAGMPEAEPAPVLAAVPVPAPVAAPVAAAAAAPAAAADIVHASSNGGGVAHPIVLSEPAVSARQLADVESADNADSATDDLPQLQDAPAAEDGPVHRQLIRATLPRIEGHKEVRQATDFTIRQSNGRGANLPGNHRGADPQRARPRGAHGQGQGAPSNRPPAGNGRFAGARAANQGRGQGRPQGGGFRTGQPQRRNGNGAPNSGGGRKRSR
jgi:hypothetical protein